jgi:hypothetical protein
MVEANLPGAMNVTEVFLDQLRDDADSGTRARNSCRWHRIPN